FFFFFQAEDGIRDLIVTGVQTCALPISAELAVGRAHALQLTALDGKQHILRGLVALDDAEFRAEYVVEHGRHDAQRRGGAGAARSEERRVGKEGRSRWGGRRERRELKGR